MIVILKFSCLHFNYDYWIGLKIYKSWYNDCTISQRDYSLDSKPCT